MLELILSIALGALFLMLALVRQTMDRVIWFCFSAASFLAASLIDVIAHGTGSITVPLHPLYLGLGLTCIALAIVSAIQLVRG